MAARQFERRLGEARADLQGAENKSHGEIAELERRIRDLHADEKIVGLERRIADLHAEDRIAEVERRMKPALGRLEADIDRLGG